MAKCRAERRASVSVFDEMIENDVEGKLHQWLGNTLPRAAGARTSLSTWGGEASECREDASSTHEALSMLRSSSCSVPQPRARARSSCATRTKSRCSTGSSSADDDVLTHGSSEEKVVAMFEELETAREQLNMAGNCGNALMEEVRQLTDEKEQLLKDKAQMEHDLENNSKRYLLDLRQARDDMEASSQLLEVELADCQSTILCLREELKLSREEVTRREDTVQEMSDKMDELELELSANKSPSVNGNSPVKRNRLRTVRRRSFRFAGARRVASGSSQHSDSVELTCEIGIQTERNPEEICKEATCPHVERLKREYDAKTADLREEMVMTTDYSFRRRKQMRDLQDELQECRHQLQECTIENTDLREELDDRVAELRLWGATAKTPAGLSIMNEMTTFSFPASVVTAMPIEEHPQPPQPPHTTVDRALATVSEVEGSVEELLPARSPGDGACLSPDTHLQHIHESAKELSELRDDIQMAINKLNSMFLETQEEEIPDGPDNNILFDPKQPLKTTTSLPTSLLVARKPSLANVTSEPLAEAAEDEERCTLNYEMEVLHLKETVRELLATAEVSAKTTQNYMPAVGAGGSRRPRLRRSCSVDPVNVVDMVASAGRADRQRRQNSNEQRSRFGLQKAWSQFNCKDKPSDTSPVQRCSSGANPKAPIDDKVPLEIFKYRVNSLQGELVQTRLEMGSLEAQLLEAVKQKMKMAEQIDDWQTDMETVIVDRVNKQTSNAKLSTQRTPTPDPTASPKRRRLSLANLLGSSRKQSSAGKSPTKDARQPVRTARTFDPNSESFRNTDFWTLSGKNRGNAQETSKNNSAPQEPVTRKSQLRRAPSPASATSSPSRTHQRPQRSSISRPTSFVEPPTSQPTTPTSKRKSSGGSSPLPKWGR